MKVAATFSWVRHLLLQGVHVFLSLLVDEHEIDEHEEGKQDREHGSDDRLVGKDGRSRGGAIIHCP